jgi:membrane-associated phospholipid phosphatase
MTPRRWQWLGVGLGGIVFALDALDVALGGPVSGFDESVYDRITAWEQSGMPIHWWSEAFTAPTGTLPAALIVAAVVTWWWVRGSRRLALWGAGGSLAALLAIVVAKHTFQRELTPMAAGAWYRYSFPSGHTVGAAAALGLLILLGAQRRIDRLGLQGQAARRAWTIAVSVWATLALLTGLARVLTQKHWASDVLASWGIGVALACGTLLLARIPSGPAPGAENHPATA